MVPLIQKLISTFQKPDPCRRFGDWLRCSHGHLLRYARIFSESEHEAESILSNALAGVMKAFYAGKVSERDLLPYMLRAIRNESLKSNRQNELRRRFELPCGEVTATCQHHSLDSVMTDEQALIENAVSQLPAELALVLRLVFWEGLSFADIARSHGIPKSTVRYRYEKAIELLKPLLSHIPRP